MSDEEKTTEPVTEATVPFEPKQSKARDLILRLITEAKMNVTQISEATNGRMSRRTLYRWLKGQTRPCRKSDEKVLEYLVMARCRGAENAVREGGS
jgi:hypothetical protein